MGDRIKRALIAVSLGLAVTAVGNRLDFAFTRLGVPRSSKLLDDLIIGCVAALCAYGWASLLADRHSRQLLAEKLGQEAVVRERTRMACEVHDTLAQGFSGIVVNLEAADELLGECPEAQKLCERALRISRESLAEARSLVRELRPALHEGENLRKVVTHLVKELTDGVDLLVDCFVDEASNKQSSDTARELLQIIREALNNVVKHAHANEARVTLCASGNQIHLCVEDDGQGFEWGHALAGDGFGLTSMRERAKKLGGLLWIYTRPRHGTQVVAFVPIPSESDPRSRPCEIAIPYESLSPTTTRSSVTDSARS